MLRRQLSDQMIELLTPTLRQIVDDWELQVEIRDEAVTIYHRGAALLRDIHLENGRLTGAIHYKYVPLRRPEGSDYLRISGDDDGFGFESVPQPLALGRLTPEVLVKYKRMMKSVSRNPEADIVHGIVSRPENRIVDQELKFQESGLPEADKIDLCHFDAGLNCLALVEVKGLHDSRLQARDDEAPEVIDQLRRYRSRIEQHREEIVRACEDSIALKRRLGFSVRLQGIPESGPPSLMRKPVLVIGGCSRDDVRSMLDENSEWQVLMEGLAEEASAVVLCGRNGCCLNLKNGRQTRMFDASIF